MKTTLLFIALGILVAGHTRVQPEPRAGTWKTWVIPSGEAYRLPPPPDAAATLAEEKTLLRMQHQRDSSVTQRIEFWNAGAPGYRWQAAIEKLYDGFPPAWIRGKALMNVAIYDATVAAWHTKTTYKRLRPSIHNKTLTAYLANPDSPSYPCEHAVAAGAAATVLSYLFPAKADSIRQVAEAACQSRVLAGMVYPSDSKAGFELGQRVGRVIVERARTDGADAVWDGKRPTGAGLWNDKRPPIQPLAGACKPWVLKAGNQFRPGPPPEPAGDMKELKQFKKTPAAVGRAFYWASNDFWGTALDQKLFEHNLHLNPPLAARAYALVSVAAQDAYIACWDAKYAYWSIRPNQYDTTYVPPLMDTPPHPSYPSGHATISMARATVLGYLFPEAAAYFVEKAKEAAESRFEGGVHFRVDNVVGMSMGHHVGEEVVKWARHDGAETRPVLVHK
ncbi:phosphatase PAP2 family protein [Spirosoma rigui]|uniref:phosphatase PAP2 family protein n=1 Tax=Spirosoma rigui TaxID=564064 RepID=UPI0009B0F831|nr:phosphatase PAP2 family protein [Spirosoma rigui]